MLTDNMIKKVMMLALGLLCGLGTMTAQVRTHSLGVELGSHNVLLYELTLARHFSVVSRTGLVVGAEFSAKRDVNGKQLTFGGLIPFVDIEPRWHFSRDSSSGLYHTGGYLSLRFDGEWDRATLFGHKYAMRDDRPQYTLAFGPYFGWTFRVTDNSYLRLATGLNFFRTKVAYYSGGHYWRTTNTESAISVGLEMVYGIRF